MKGWVWNRKLTRVKFAEGLIELDRYLGSRCRYFACRLPAERRRFLVLWFNQQVYWREFDNYRQLTSFISRYGPFEGSQLMICGWPWFFGEEP